MAFTLFDFTKSWRNAGDFPTFEPDEAKVREDMQSLFDELKTGLNRLIGELKASNLPFTPTAEVDSSDVQNAIENVQSQIASAILGELPDGSVTAQKLSDGAVETDKIEDGAVTAEKIAAGVLPEGAENNPLMDGEASAGESTAFAREDHVHPKDSTKADIVGGRVLPSQLIKARVNVTTSRALELSDEGKALYISSGSAVTVTIPVNSAVELPIGSEIILYRAGTGTVIVDAASGVTLHCSGDLSGLGQYDSAKLKKWEANVWTYELNHNGVSDGGITNAKLADGAVTAAKIDDGAVTAGKIAANAVSTLYTATIPADGWDEGENTVSVSGLLATDKPIIDVDMTDVADMAAVQDAWGAVLKISVAANSLTAYSADAPTEDIPIKILCVRK